MTKSTSGSADGPASVSGHRFEADGVPVDPSLVLVVGRSRIDVIVVSKIVERCGLRCISVEPEAMRLTPGRPWPALVILDGGVSGADCVALMEPLAAARRLSGGQAPAVLLLSTGNFHRIEAGHAGVVDAVVPKPILPEVLQPVVRRLVGAGAR